jgi:hypothetical protein
MLLKLVSVAVAFFIFGQALSWYAAADMGSRTMIGILFAVVGGMGFTFGWLWRDR